MSEPSLSLRGLMRQRARPGQVVFIGIRPERGAPMLPLAQVELLAQRGLAGDIASRRSHGKRQVSLLQAEHLPVIAGLTGRERVDPTLLRRNLVITGVNVLAFRAAEFRVGGALLKGTGLCEPCSKMERALGEGGYTAMRGHGGILAEVLISGLVRIGDQVDFAGPERT